MKPISGPSAKPADMSDANWVELDALAKSTIRLHLAESVYLTVVSEISSFNLWKKLCSTYKKETASNKVYLMKRLFELQMKEGTLVALHLNEFNIIFSQMQVHRNSNSVMKSRQSSCCVHCLHHGIPFIQQSVTLCYMGH